MGDSGISKLFYCSKCLTCSQYEYMLAHTKMPSSGILWSHSQLGWQAKKLINAEMAIPTPQPWKWITLHLLINLHYIGPICPNLKLTNIYFCFSCCCFFLFFFLQILFTDIDSEVKIRKHSIFPGVSIWFSWVLLLFLFHIFNGISLF